jgi:hypothetical protein
MPYQGNFIDLAWMAGLFEGEGTVSLTAPQDSRRTGHVRVSMCNVDRQLVDPFIEWWGGYFRHKYNPPGNRRQAAEWTIDSLKAQRFLQAIRPYVRCDRMKARIDLALAFQESKSSHRIGGHPVDATKKAFQEDCRRRMLILNHRGALPS